MMGCWQKISIVFFNVTKAIENPTEIITRTILIHSFAKYAWMQLCWRSCSTGQKRGSPESWFLVSPGCCWVLSCNVRNHFGCSGSEQSTHLPVAFQGMLSAGPALNNRAVYIKCREWLETAISFLKPSDTIILTAKAILNSHLLTRGSELPWAPCGQPIKVASHNGTLADILHFSKGHFPQVVWGRRLWSLGLQ